jgi:hypothetical protein
LINAEVVGCRRIRLCAVSAIVVSVSRVPTRVRRGPCQCAGRNLAHRLSGTSRNR